MDGSGPLEVLITLSQPWDVILDTTITNYTDWRQRFLPTNTELDGPGDDINGDGIQNGIAYALGDGLPILSLSPPALHYTLRRNANDLDNLRVELSMDLETWRHNGDGEGIVSMNFTTPGLPDDSFQLIRSEAVPPFDTAEQLYLRIVLP